MDTKTIETTAWYQLVYHEMSERPDGLIETTGGTVLDDEGDLDIENTLFATEMAALDCFLDNLTDPGALGHDLGGNLRAEEVTEGYMGWGTVVRQAWTEDCGPRQRLFSVTIKPYMAEENGNV